MTPMSTRNQSRKGYANLIVVGCSSSRRILSREDLSKVSAALKKAAPNGAPILVKDVPARVPLGKGVTAILEAAYVEPDAYSIEIHHPGELHEGQIERIITCLQIAIFSKGEHVAIVPEHLGIVITKQ